MTRCRPLSVSMGNAITHLKFRISSIPPELPESEVSQLGDVSVRGSREVIAKLKPVFHNYPHLIVLRLKVGLPLRGMRPIILGILNNDSVLYPQWLHIHLLISLQAKESLLQVIDDYINEKIVLADEAISQSCSKIINDGDVILVHAQYVTNLIILSRIYYYYCTIYLFFRDDLYSSSIVQKCLVDAHKAGKNFRVIVVDSRPKMEGLYLLVVR